MKAKLILAGCIAAPAGCFIAAAYLSWDASFALVVAGVCLIVGECVFFSGARS